jgi:hypothetical protein
MFSFNKSFAVIIIAIAILLLFIVYYFIFKSGNGVFKRQYMNNSNILGESRFKEPHYTNVKKEDTYRDVPEELDAPSEETFYDTRRVVEGQKNGYISDDTTFLGGLYRRRPKRHKKKKPSLNKNKYKKHGKPRK